MPAAVDPLVARGKSLTRRGPDIGRRFGSKCHSVGLQRPGVLIPVARGLSATPSGRSMMKRPPEDLRAEFTPIMARIDEMKVPRLIDFVRWRDSVVCGHREIEEPVILVQDTVRIRGRPSVLFCQPRDECPVSSFRLDLHRIEPDEQRLLPAG